MPKTPRNRASEPRHPGAYESALIAGTAREDNPQVSPPAIAFAKMLSDEARPSQPSYHAKHAKTSKLGAPLAAKSTDKDEDNAGTYINKKGSTPSKGRHGKPYEYTHEEDMWSYKS